jgi:hypothetical protein
MLSYNTHPGTSTDLCAWRFTAKMLHSFHIFSHMQYVSTSPFFIHLSQQSQMKKINYEAHQYAHLLIPVLLFHPVLRYKYSEQPVLKHCKYTEIVFCFLLLDVPKANTVTLKMEAARSSEHREQLKIQYGAVTPKLIMCTSTVETENIPTTSLLPFSLENKVRRRFKHFKKSNILYLHSLILRFLRRLMEIILVRLNWITNCRSDPFMKLRDSSALLSGSIIAVTNIQNKILH